MHKSKIYLLLEEIGSEITSIENKNRTLYTSAIDVDDEVLSLKIQRDSFKTLRQMRGLKAALNTFENELKKSGILEGDDDKSNEGNEGGEDGGDCDEEDGDSEESDPSHSDTVQPVMPSSSVFIGDTDNKKNDELVKSITEEIDEIMSAVETPKANTLGDMPTPEPQGKSTLAAEPITNSKSILNEDDDSDIETLNAGMDIDATSTAKDNLTDIITEINDSINEINNTANREIETQDNSEVVEISGNNISDDFVDDFVDLLKNDSDEFSEFDDLKADDAPFDDFDEFGGFDDFKDEPVFDDTTEPSVESIVEEKAEVDTTETVKVEPAPLKMTSIPEVSETPIVSGVEIPKVEIPAVEVKSPPEPKEEPVFENDFSGFGMGQVEIGIYNNRQPSNFTMFGRRVDIGNWIDMLTKVCEILILKNPYTVAQFDKYNDLNPLGNCYFSYNQGEIKNTPQKLSNGMWIETKRTPDDIVMLCKKMLEICGYPRSELEIELSD